MNISKEVEVIKNKQKYWLRKINKYILKHDCEPQIQPK